MAQRFAYGSHHFNQFLFPTRTTQAGGDWRMLPMRLLRDAATTLWHGLTGSPRSPWQQARDLRTLDDHLLADIGVTRDEAARLPAQTPRAAAAAIPTIRAATEADLG